MKLSVQKKTRPGSLPERREHGAVYRVINLEMNDRLRRELMTKAR